MKGEQQNKTIVFNNHFSFHTRQSFLFQNIFYFYFSYTTLSSAKGRVLKCRIPDVQGCCQDDFRSTEASSFRFTEIYRLIVSSGTGAHLEVHVQHSLPNFFSIYFTFRGFMHLMLKAEVINYKGCMLQADQM